MAWLQLTRVLRGAQESKAGPQAQLIDAGSDAVREAYLGGIQGADGNVYGIPGGARRVMLINTESDTVSYIGPELPPGKHKWLRAVTAGSDGAIYCIPSHGARLGGEWG